MPRALAAAVALMIGWIPLPQHAVDTTTVIPHVISAEVPQYPREAVESGLSGTLTLNVLTDGTRVTAVLLGEAMNVPAALRDAAMANVRTWKFSQHPSTRFDVTYRYAFVDRPCDRLGRDTHEAAVIRFPLSVEIFAELDPACPGSTRLPPVFGIYVRNALVPVFPPAALAQGVDGDVTIGVTYKAVLSVADGPSALGEPVMNAIRDSWQFNPGPYAEEFHFKFRLEDGECRGGPDVTVGPGLTSYEIKDRKSCGK